MPPARLLRLQRRPRVARPLRRRAAPRPRVSPRAANFPIDAHLCDAIADAVYSVWRAQRAATRLVTANQALEQERKNNEWNMRIAATSGTGGLGAPSAKNTAAADQYVKDKNLE